MENNHGKEIILRQIKHFFQLLVFLMLINNCAEDVPYQYDPDIYDFSSLNFGTDTTFSVITWNVEHFPKNYQTTINTMVDLIIGLKIDIISLQEIENHSYFLLLIDELNNSDSLYNWVGYRAGIGGYQELAYLINNSTVEIHKAPYTILNDYSHYFAYREPYVLEVTFSETKLIIINNHFKCCGNGTIENDGWDEEYRRQKASFYLKNYIDSFFSVENVIVLGDFNDILNDLDNSNVFQNFIVDETNYKFVDMNIANGSLTNWSYPGWPSHLDHILITNELFDEYDNDGSFVQTIHLEEYFPGGWNEYEKVISDHRPVGLKLVLLPVN